MNDSISSADAGKGLALSGDYSELVAQRSAIDARIAEIETVEVPAMRDRWEREAAAIGKTAAEVLKGKNARGGRKSKSKPQDE